MTTVHVNPYDCDQKELPARIAGNLSRAAQRALRVNARRPPAPPAPDRPTATLAWGRLYLAAHFTKPPSPMHEWLATELDAMHTERGVKLNLIGPRASAKSTVATLCYVLRAALEGWEPYIWIISDTMEQAHIHLDNLKVELEVNRLLHRDYPASVGRGRYWRSGAIELPNRVTIDAYGTGQSVRGRRRSADRPSLIVCDDLQNDAHIVSAAEREASRQWFWGTLVNAGTKDTNIVNLATALHRDALALELDRTAGWSSRAFPSIRKWPVNTNLWDEWDTIYCNVDDPDAKREARAFYEQHREQMNAGAVVLWPAVEDLYTLMQMRVEIGQAAFAREKQGQPANPDVCEWPASYFDDSIWFDQWPRDLQARAIALDPSKGRDARHGDYSAYVMVGIDARGVVYVEADLARRPTPLMVTDGAALCARYRPDAFGVEANQYQELLCGELAAEFTRQGLGHVTPCAIHNLTSKIVRIRTLGTHLSKRRFRFKRGSSSTELLVHQLRDFPIGDHDDGPDALEMALRLAEEVLHGRRDDGLGNRLPIGV